MIYSDFLVIGGGIIGINTARELKKMFSDSKVILIEKEKDCGLHASGRNSGVLHAGFYYSPDSLKAKFTRFGNKLLTEYCETNKIAINKCGKLVVAKDSSDLMYLDELLKRGRNNGIQVEEITEDEAKKIEPRAKTHRRALFSPTTSTVDPVKVVQAMKLDVINEGTEIHSGVSFIKRKAKGILTSAGVYHSGYVVNCSGLYADRIALEFGFSERYRILPFKGLYLYSDEFGCIGYKYLSCSGFKKSISGSSFYSKVDGKSR
jgi:L-2-hydroxyglutarate oxidase LhgO